MRPVLSALRPACHLSRGTRPGQFYPIQTWPPAVLSPSFGAGRMVRREEERCSHEQVHFLSNVDRRRWYRYRLRATRAHRRRGSRADRRGPRWAGSGPLRSYRHRQRAKRGRRGRSSGVDQRGRRWVAFGQFRRWLRHWQRTSRGHRGHGAGAHQHGPLWTGSGPLSPHWLTRLWCRKHSHGTCLVRRIAPSIRVAPAAGTCLRQRASENYILWHLPST